MALFHILSPIQRLSQEDLPDQKKIESEWAASKDSYAKRKQIAEQLQFPDPNQDSLLEARRLTGAEIATARELKVSEADVLIDLEKTEHSQKIRKVHKLEACLGYVKSRAEQLFHLLMMWKDTLEKQEFLLDYLVSGSRNEKLLTHLRLELEIEGHILDQMASIPSLLGLLETISKRASLAEQIDAHKKRLFAHMDYWSRRAPADALPPGLLFHVVDDILAALSDQVDRAFEQGIISGLHQDADLEFIHRPKFIDLVAHLIELRRAKIAAQHPERPPKKPLSRELVEGFVRSFREAYDHP